jgi:hypothetical protein
VAWIIDRVRESLKTVFCYYLKLAQAGTAVKEIAFGRGTLGRRILKGIAKLVGFYVLTSIVARECTLVPVEVSPVVSPPTAETLVPTVPAVGYTGYATVSLYADERLSYAPPLSGTATVTLVATESATAAPPTGTVYGESAVSLQVSESVSTTAPPARYIAVTIDSTFAGPEVAPVTERPAGYATVVIDYVVTGPEVT